MRFSVINLGCKVNRVESDQITALLLSSFEETDPNNADLVVVNTCTVTSEAEKKTRKVLRHTLRKNPSCKVIVTGCASEINPAAFEALSERVQVVPKNQILGYLTTYTGEDTSAYLNILEQMPIRYSESFNTRVGIKIQDGCNNACTYCIVHVARGKSKSVPADQVVNECVSYANSGAKEMVLTGINLGSYNYAEASSPVNLCGLLQRLLDETAEFTSGGGACRFRLSSIEPNDLSMELVDLMASSNGRICKHLHLPLQSGSTRILKEMARNYDARFYANLVHELRQKIPHLSLTTDVIVGFPGETDVDFEETLSLAQECGFSKIHVFPYSKRAGTPAANRTDQISDNIKRDRAVRLRQLSDELRAADFAARTGLHELAVVEKFGRAMTDSYYEIICAQENSVGDLIEVEINSQVSFCKGGD